MNKKAELKLPVQLIVGILAIILLFLAIFLALRSKFVMFSPWYKMKLSKFNKKGMTVQTIVTLIILAILLLAAGMLYLMLSKESNSMLDALLNLFWCNMATIGKIVSFVIPIVLLLIITLIFFGGEGTWEDMKGNIQETIDWAKSFMPSFGIGMDGMASDASVTAEHRDQILSLNLTIHEMLSSTKTNCFAETIYFYQC